MSSRSAPSSTAADTSWASRSSMARRRRSASSSISLLPRTRSSRVTAGRCWTSTADAAVHRGPQPLVRRRRLVGGRRVERGGEAVEGLVEGLLQQVGLARHVVVDRGLGEAELGGEVAHAGRVVPLPVEQVDRAAQHRLLVVPGASAARPRRRRPRPRSCGQILTPRPSRKARHDLRADPPGPVPEARRPRPGRDRCRATSSAALQLERLRWTLQHAYANVPHYRAAWDAAGVHPDDCTELADLARFPFTTKKDLRDNYPFGMFAVPREQVARDPRVVGHDGQADRRRLHQGRPRHLGRRGGPVDPRGRRAPGDEGARRLRLRAVHRWARGALRRRAARLHGDPDVGRPDGEAGPAHPRLRAGHHHGDPVVHALDPRRDGAAGHRPADDVAQGRHLRGRAVDDGHAGRDRAAAGRCTRSTSTGCPR